MATRGNYEVGVSRRAAIIAAALEQFGESGYHGTSLRAVATRVGMSHPGLLHHFDSKEDLLRAVLEERDAQSVQAFAMESHDPMDFLRGLVALAEFNAHRKGIVELYSVLSAEATTPSHPAHSYFVERYRTIRRSLTAAFGDLKADGRLRSEVDPAAAAVALIALSDGLQVQWLLEPEAIDMTAATRDAIQAILNVDLSTGLEIG